MDLAEDLSKTEAALKKAMIQSK